MTGFLLDINVLLALMDPAHVQHEAAHRWFQQEGETAWVTCPLTQNGVVRIASQAKYPSSPGGPGTVARLLARFVSHPGHRFWPDDISLLEDQLVSGDRIVSSSQVTDIYLLALAVRHGGKLATFDRRIPTAAVMGGAAGLRLLTEEG